MTPQSLNELALAWQQFIAPLESSQVTDTSGHIDGLHSVYLLQISIVHPDRVITFYYIGETARDPRIRLGEHVSEFNRCSVKTLHGKSDLYSPEFMHGAVGFRFSLAVLEGGFETRKAAQAREAEIAVGFEIMHPGRMISNQNRGRGKDTRPRQRRARKS